MGGAARHQGDGPATGTLYVVATPIGNPRDMTYRAIEVLSSVAIVAAEDTRDLAPLLSTYGVKARTVSYHDFNERERARHLLERLLAGDDVALVSDAGTPLVNDPGFRLVQGAIEAGVPVSSVPGPCAAVSALVTSGLALERFLFAGYPPRRQSKRRAFFEELATERATLVIYEAPHRLVDSLQDALDVLGDRDACLARNLTKPHERYQRGSLTALLGQLRGEGEIRGEITVILAGRGCESSQGDEEAARSMASGLARGDVPARTAVAELQRAFGLRRKAAYALLLDARRAAMDGAGP